MQEQRFPFFVIVVFYFFIILFCSYCSRFVDKVFSEDGSPFSSRPLSSYLHLYAGSSKLAAFLNSDGRWPHRAFTSAPRTATLQYRPCRRSGRLFVRHTALTHTHTPVCQHQSASVHIKYGSGVCRCFSVESRLLCCHSGRLASYAYSVSCKENLIDLLLLCLCHGIIPSSPQTHRLLNISYNATALTMTFLFDNLWDRGGDCVVWRCYRHRQPRVCPELTHKGTASYPSRNRNVTAGRGNLQISHDI